MVSGNRKLSASPNAEDLGLESENSDDEFFMVENEYDEFDDFNPFGEDLPSKPQTAEGYNSDDLSHVRSKTMARAKSSIKCEKPKHLFI
jgi:hypothetical protein